MKSRRSPFLKEVIANQYPLEKYKDLIFCVLDIVENFILELGYENDYNSASISKYEIVAGSHQISTGSKVESMVIKNFETDKAKMDFIEKYFMALKSLLKEERQVFIYSFINMLDNLEICHKMGVSNNNLNRIKKSAIVRFSLKLGLDKFV